MPSRWPNADKERTVVWKSRKLAATERAQVGTDDGAFIGPLANKSQLDAGRGYYFRVRQQSEDGQISDWSPWHQSVTTSDETAPSTSQGD